MPLPRAAAAILLILVPVTSSFAQTNEQMSRPTFPEKVWGETTDDLMFGDRGNVKDNDSPYNLFMWDSIGRFRLDSKDPNSTNIGYRYLTIDFGDNAEGVPDQLDEVSVAATVHFPQSDGTRFSLLFGAGYSGDNPFADPGGVFGIGSFIYQRPLNDRDTLYLSLDYNGVGPLFPDVPLPGIAWARRGQQLSWEIGFPHDALHWQFAPEWSLDVNYRVPFTADVAVSYQLSDSFSLVGRYANVFNGFRLDDEPAENRAFFEVSRVEIGIRYVNPHLVFDWAYVDATLSVGYAFNQELSSGFDARDLDDFAQLSDEPYIGFMLRSRF